jgi:hypothetical protein
LERFLERLAAYKRPKRPKTRFKNMTQKLTKMAQNGPKGLLFWARFWDGLPSQNGGKRPKRRFKNVTKKEPKKGQKGSKGPK